MKSELCELIYVTSEDGVRSLAEIVPNEGVQLYETVATYDNGRHVYNYKILAKSKRLAKRRIEQKFSWLRVIECREIPLGSDEARKALTNWIDMPIW